MGALVLVAVLSEGGLSGSGAERHRSTLLQMLHKRCLCGDQEVVMSTDITQWLLSSVHVHEDTHSSNHVLCQFFSHLGALYSYLVLLKLFS